MTVKNKPASPLPPQGRRSQGFFKFLLLLFSIFCAVATVDLFFQWYWKIPSSGQSKKLIRYVEGELPKKKLNPGLNLYLTAAYREYRYHVTTDKNGFRRTLPYALNDAAHYRIILLGDSQTFGAGVNDNQTFASLLSTRLNQAVLNAGVPGYNNIEELQQARILLKQHQPELVILALYVGNDPYENFRNRKTLLGTGEELPLPKRKKKIDFSLPVLKNFLKRHSSLYNGLARLRRFDAVNNALYRFRFVEQSPPGEIAIYQKTGPERNAYFNITKDVVLNLAQEVAQHKAQFLLVLIADRLQIDPEYQKQWIAKYRLKREQYDFLGPNKELRNFCEKQSISFLDTTESLQKNHVLGNKPYWAIDHHLSIAGHEIVAETIAHYVKNRELNS